MAGSWQRYFLHIRDGNTRLDDPEGGDFAGLADAKEATIEHARELVAECVRWGSPMGLSRVFEIADAGGRVIATVSFSDALVRE